MQSVVPFNENRNSSSILISEWVIQGIKKEVNKGIENYATLSDENLYINLSLEGN